MSRPVRRLESERSPTVVSAIWQQKLGLQRDLRTLDSSQRLVVNRITLNQRIAFKAFKKKLHKAKLSHARIMGDREAEKTLRDRSDHQNSHFNTNSGMDPEDEEVLKKIWSQGQRDREIALLGDSNRPPGGSRQVKSAPAARGRLLSHRGDVRTGHPVRPQTVAATHLTVEGDQGVYISTGHSNKNSPRTRPTSTGRSLPSRKQFLAAGTDNDDDDKTSDIDAAESDDEDDDRLFARSRAQSKTPADGAHTIFDEDDRHKRLLASHKQRVVSADYEGRVRDLCGRLTPYNAERAYIIPDYYQTCLAKDAARLKRRVPASTPVVQPTTEAEVRRAIGNLAVRSMTLKRLSYDFGGMRRESRAETACV